jgi:hypothetical protein
MPYGRYTTEDWIYGSLAIPPAWVVVAVLIAAGVLPAPAFDVAAGATALGSAGYGAFRILVLGDPSASPAEAVSCPVATVLGGGLAVAASLVLAVADAVRS